MSEIKKKEWACQASEKSYRNTANAAKVFLSLAGDKVLSRSIILFGTRGLKIEGDAWKIMKTAAIHKAENLEQIIKVDDA